MIRLLRRLAGWTGPTWDDAAVPRLRGPILLFWIAVLLGPATTVLELSPVVHDFLHNLAKALVASSLFWVIWFPMVYWMIGLFTTLVAFPKVMLKRQRARARWISPDRGKGSI